MNIGIFLFYQYDYQTKAVHFLFHYLIFDVACGLFRWAKTEPEH